MELSWAQVAAWRARRQGLAERVPAAGLLGVASRLCGVHAQVMSSAELTLAARVDGIARADVAAELWERRRLIKTWAMRGTLHLLPTDEYPLWQAGLATLDHFRKPVWHRAFGVTPEELDLLVETIGAVLADGPPLTREQLAAAVGERAGSEHLGEKLSDNWGALLKPASFLGALCFAPSDGQKVRFTHPRAVLGGKPPRGAIAAEDALPEITRRFLAAFGPATREDYGRWWARLSPAKSKKRILALGDEVVEMTLPDAGGPAYMLAADAAEASAAEPCKSVRLLPAFDQYVIAATRHAAKLMPADHTAAVYRPQGWLSAVLLIDGRMDGIWRFERKGGAIELTVEPWVRLSAAVKRAVADEAERVASFLGGELRLSWG